MMDAKERARFANAVIGAIAEHGRQSLYSAAYSRNGRLGLDKVGQVWYVDAITGMMIYPASGGMWLGFTGSPECQYLVAHLAGYIKTDHGIDMAVIDEAIADYGDADKALVREAIQGAVADRED